MMKGFPLKHLIVALGCLLGAVEYASAQYPTINPYTRPRVSPYINMLRLGSTPGVNYYGLVRPEIETRSSLFQLQQQTQLNQQAISALQTPAGGPLTTGHPVGFMTHTSYFQNLGAGGQTGFGTTGTGGAITPQASGSQPRSGGSVRPPSRGGR